MAAKKKSTKASKPRSRSRKFDRDIILQNDDGRVYYISQDDLKKKFKPADLESSPYQLVKGLLKHGVVAAAIPTVDEPLEPDFMCYLVNLGSLKQDKLEKK